MEIDVLGKWYELDATNGKQGEASGDTTTRTVTQYFGNGKFNSEGHMTLKMTPTVGAKVEVFYEIFCSGEWELLGQTLYETVSNVKISLIEVFVNDVLVTEEDAREEFSALQDEFPIGITSESHITSSADGILLYTQLDDFGKKSKKTKHKTSMSYEKYVEREL